MTVIRAATQNDVARLVELGAAMHAESSYRNEPYDPAKVGALLSGLVAGAGVVFAAERAGVVVGGIAGAVAPNWFNDELLGFEYGLFMEPAARTSGIAAARLIDAFVIWCRHRGARRVRAGITTGVHTDSTARLYQARGFVPEGVFLQKEFNDVHRG